MPAGARKARARETRTQRDEFGRWLPSTASPSQARGAPPLLHGLLALAGLCLALGLDLAELLAVAQDDIHVLPHGRKAAGGFGARVSGAPRAAAPTAANRRPHLVKGQELAHQHAAVAEGDPHAVVDEVDHLGALGQHLQRQRGRSHARNAARNPASAQAARGTRDGGGGGRTHHGGGRGGACPPSLLRGAGDQRRAAASNGSERTAVGCVGVHPPIAPRCSSRRVPWPLSHPLHAHSRPAARRQRGRARERAAGGRGRRGAVAPARVREREKTIWGVRPPGGYTGGDSGFGGSHWAAAAVHGACGEAAEGRGGPRSRWRGRGPLVWTAGRRMASPRPCRRARR